MTASTLAIARLPDTPVVASVLGLAPLAADTTANVINRPASPPGAPSLVALRCTNEPARPSRVEKLFDRFYSHVLDNHRDIYVYLPPGYDRSCARDLPVIYMHDGQNLFDPARGFGGQCWRVGEAMDRGIASGVVPKAIVVAVDNSPDRLYEMTPSSDGQRRSGGGERYLRFVVDELMPEVERWLGVVHQGERTAMIGSSLGGLISLHAALRYPEVFGRIGALSPSTWWNDQEMVREGALFANHPPARIYLDSGDSGPSQDGMQATAELAQAIRSVGLGAPDRFEHRIEPGAMHNEAAWARRLPEVLRFLLGDLV